jgi:hypothetical protein
MPTKIIGIEKYSRLHHHGIAIHLLKVAGRSEDPRSSKPDHRFILAVPHSYFVGLQK